MKNTHTKPAPPAPHIIATGQGEDFWLINFQVYRAPHGTATDANGFPTASRWECPLWHWNHYRANFKWAVDVAPNHPPKITIKKFTNADRSWGSPGNNYKISAKYNVLVDGILRGKLWAAGQIRYMDAPVWEISTINPDETNIRPLRSIFFGGKKAAVKWITANVEKFIR